MSEPRDARSPASAVQALPVAVLDPDGTIAFAGGDDLGGIAGHAPATIEGRSLLDFVHPEDLMVVLDHFGAVRDRRTPTDEVAARIRGPEGAYRDVALVFHEVPASSDVFVWCRDITATVMAAEAMQSSVLHSALVEHTRSLLAVFELDGRLRFLNPAALEMFEDTCRDAGPNATLADLVHPDDVAEMLTRFAEAASAPRRRIPCELRIRREGRVADAASRARQPHRGSGRARCRHGRRRRHRATRPRAPCPPRPAHRRGQPRAAHRPVDPFDVPPRPQPPAVDGRLRRPRPVQVRQRQARPRHGRRRARGSREPVDGLGTPRRHRGPARRRRVRHRLPRPPRRRASPTISRNASSPPSRNP